MFFSISQLEDALVFLRHCGFLGERARSLSKDLAEILSDHIEAIYCLENVWYPFDEHDW